MTMNLVIVSLSVSVCVFVCVFIAAKHSLACKYIEFRSQFSSITRLPALALYAKFVTKQLCNDYFIDIQFCFVATFTCLDCYMY